jgi:hypothetical protein
MGRKKFETFGVRIFVRMGERKKSALKKNGRFRIKYGHPSPSKSNMAMKDKMAMNS